MTRSSYRDLVATTAAAVAIGLLAGCSPTIATPVVTQTVTAPVQSTTATPTATASDPSAPTAPSSSAATQSASSMSSTAKVDPDAPAGQCKDAVLRVSVQYDPEAAGAGQRGAFVVFRNTADNSCHLEGTPGLSLVGGGNGTRIGEPADRNTTDAQFVTLAPGKAALARVQYTYVDKNGGDFSDGNGHNPSCRAKAVDGYRVYPPHSYRAYFTPTKTYACSTDLHWITVSPVRPASDFKFFTPRN